MVNPNKNIGAIVSQPAYLMTAKQKKARNQNKRKRAEVL